MSKTKKLIKPSKKNGNFLQCFSTDNFIPQRYQLILSLCFILLLFLAFYAPMYFGNETFESGDIITSRSMVPYVEKERDGYTLWNPHIFCGMPAHAIAVEYKWFNLVYVGITSVKSIFKSLFSVDYAVWTFYLLLLAVTSFLLVKHLTGSILISLFSATAASFSTGIVVFLFIGHVTKLTALCMFPLILLFLLRFQRQIKLMDFAILIIAMNLLVQGWHVQIIFYTLFSVCVFFVYFLCRFLVRKEKEQVHRLIKSVGVFIIASIIGLLIQIDNFSQVYFYSDYSTRGTKNIVEQNTSLPENAGSAFYDYATQWSFSPGEIITFIIPSYYGFGNSTYKGPLTNNNDFELNTYFGQMEAVDVAMYMGVIVFFLGLTAIFTNWKNPYVQFLTLLTSIALFISFGKNFSPVYDLMFFYFPAFDKFRVPSMALVIVQISFPVLAGLGLKKIILLKERKDQRLEKIIKFTAFTFTGLFLLSILFNGSIKTWFTGRINESGKFTGELQYFIEYASDMFTGDIFIATGFAALLFWFFRAYLLSKISRDVLLITIIILCVTDLFRIDSRGAQYKSERIIDQLFTEPDYVTAIRQQNDKEPFRIISLKERAYGHALSPLNSNYHAYFLMDDIYGYSGVKPRAYQDFIDVLGTPANPTLWRMANVKYIILDKPINYPGLTKIFSSAQNVVYRNENALPRAYFVDSISQEPAIEMLNKMKNNQFDPKHVCFVEDMNLKVNKPDSAAYIKIQSSKDENILIEASATGNNLLVLSDTYYPNGWNVYIDGNETKI